MIHLLVGPARGQQKIVCGVNTMTNLWSIVLREVTCPDCKAIETGRRMRFVIVFYDTDLGCYMPALTNQERYHFDDKKEALDTAEVFKVTYKGRGELRVIEAECYDHGDCFWPIFTPEYVAVHEVKP